MIPYLCLATFPAIFAVIYCTGKDFGVNSNEKTKKVFLAVVGLAIFLMIALRSKYNGSTDSLNYYNTWKDLSDASFGQLQDYMKESLMEKGFLLTIWSLSHIFENPQFIFVFSGALFTIAVCNFIYRNSEDMILSTVMFVSLGIYGFMVQGMRQAMAMSICLFAIELCKKRNFWHFLAFVGVVLFATFYHTSAIVFLIVYFLYGLKMNAVSGLAFTLFCGVLIACSNMLVAIGNEIFDSNYGVAVESGGFIATAIYVLIVAAAILLKNENECDKNYSFLIYFTALGMVLYFMRYLSAQAAERVSFYFMFGQMALLPKVLNRLPNREKNIAKIIVFILCIALYAYRLKSSNYDFFWQ